jgi:hypothetical protein
MKLLTLLQTGALALSAIAAPAFAAFSGPLAPSQWTTTTAGPTFGSHVDTSTAPASISLIGGDDASGMGCPDGTASGFLGGCQLSFTIAAAGDYSFDWSFSTQDISPQYDSFGMLVDGVRVELVANGGDVLQSGSTLVHAGTSFGWYINCSDCTGGAATATISNVAAVPEPATYALFALGLVAIAGLSTRRGHARV